MKKLVYVIYSIVFILALYYGYGKISGYIHSVKATNIQVKTISNDDFSVGNKDAKYHVLYFLDYSCDYCRQFNSTLKEFIKKYGDDVYITYYPLPWLGENSNNMAIGAVASAYEGRFFEANDKIFSSDKIFTDEDALKLVDFFDIDPIKFYNYLEAEEKNKTILNNLELAKKYKIEGIPTIIANGKQYALRELPNAEELMAIIKKLYGD